MESGRRSRPPKRDYTTTDLEAPSPTLSSSSGVSQKPDFRSAADDIVSNVGTQSSESYNLKFRTDFLGSPSDGTLEHIETIQCPICLDLMTTPKTLPCLHNACKKCLQQHILSFLRDDIQNDVTPTAFPCPVCHRNTSPPDQNAGCEKWAALFPTNFFLQAYGMILAVRREEVECDPCVRRGESTLASWWCRECSEYQCNVCKTVHSGFKIFKHHSVINVKDIAKNPDIAVPKYEPCAIHEREKITHFCREHRLPCCATCLVSAHRKCEHVVTIQEEFMTLKSKHGYENLAGLLSLYEDTANELIEARKNILDDIEARRQAIIDKVKSIREGFEEDLRKLEEHLLNDFDKFHAEEKKKLEELMEECENLGKQISNAVNLVETVHQSGNESHMINLLEKVTRECQTYERALQENQSKLQHVDYDFYVNNTIETALKTSKNLGNINIKRTKQKPRTVISANPFEKGGVKEVARLRVWIAGDRGRCGIVGGVYLEDGRLLLADFDNFKLKLFNESGRLLSKLVLKSKPSDITMIDTETFAVTYPSATGFQFIHVRRNIISEGTYIDTRRIFHSLSYTDGYLYLACNAGISVSDKEGKEVNFLQLREHGIPAFHSPSHVKATSKGLIVTDHEKHSVNFLSLDGRLLHSYTAKDLNHPQGVDVDIYGNIIVCCKHSSNVHQLNEDGQRVKVILAEKDGIESPIVASFQKFGRRFFISEAKISNRDFIRVYEWI